MRTILETSKVKSNKGLRYQSDWVYECILLRIKSPKGYEHIRRRQLLPLPSVTTLNRYMKFIKSQYGFQEIIFEGIKLKTKDMSPLDVHGVYTKIKSLLILKGKTFLHYRGSKIIKYY